ncbi:MAG: glycosyltransferase family 4 protein [Pirellulales bacterium]|nr:glycosyltransferase family 4 protein [Pirellulales bacterium]
MRVAHIITRLILGGAQENTVYNCADLIHRHGDEVLLITGPPLGPEGSLIERAKAAGIPLAIVPQLRRAIHPLRDAVSYRQLKRLLRDYRPDVVHTHSAKAGVLGRIAARRAGVPVVVHGVHGAPWHPYQSAAARTLFQACERYAARSCDHFICVADAMRDLMVAEGIAPAERFTTIYSGMEVAPFLAADTQRDRVRAELGFAPEHVVIGKIARLFHLKGHDDVIAAAEQLVRSAPQARFLFVGDGVLAAELKQSIHRSGLDEYFRFTGLVPPERIPELIGAMDVLAHASLREGLARALPQALIAGKPVVTYDIDGAREVAIPGETGYLLSPRDVPGMARALLELAADPKLRERLGSEGRRRFADLFRHERMTEETRAIYERLLNAKRSRAG